MNEVRIFIESTWKGPAKRDGVAIWLVEARIRGEPVTRQGFIHLEDGTETRGNLMAMINAFSILRKPCSVLVLMRCDHILSTIGNGWDLQWKENGWKTTKDKPVKNADLWEMLDGRTRLHEYRVKKEEHEYQKIMQMELERELNNWKRKVGKPA